MPLTDDDLQRLEDLGRGLARLRRMAGEIADGMDRAIRESDRRAEEYLPILRRAGIVPLREVPPRRRSRWW